MSQLQWKKEDQERQTHGGLPKLRRDGQNMNYPPEGCRYQVDYKDRDGLMASSGLFRDEFQLGDWFLAQEAAGEIDRSKEGRPDGFRIYCVYDKGRIGIDHNHPRLVRGRLEPHPTG